jgi:hypothetical protein
MGELLSKLAGDAERLDKIKDFSEECPEAG